MPKTPSRKPPQTSSQLLQLYVGRRLPNIARRSLASKQTKTHEAARLFRRQYTERQAPVIALLARTLRADLEKGDILDSIRFLADSATFYDLELLVTDVARYKRHLDRWKKHRRSQLLKKRSDLNIHTAVKIAAQYSRDVSNESNMFAGRNTLANPID